MSRKEQKQIKPFDPKRFGVKWSSHYTSIILHTTMIGYLTYYCTNSLGLSAGLTGMILLISKILDAFTDAVGALVIERTDTKMGKARPYVLMMPLCWILTLIFFSQPIIASTTGKAFFLFFMYFMINSVCLTMVNVAEPVFLARALENPDDSSSVLSVSGLIASVIAIVAGVVLPILLEKWENIPHGWLMLTAVVAIPGIVLSLIRFFSVHEKKDATYSVEEKPKFKVKDYFRVLGQNKHVLLLLLVQIMYGLSSGTGPATTYYFKYVIGSIGMSGLVGAFCIPGMLTLALVPKLKQKMPVKKIMMFGLAIGSLGGALRLIPSIPVLCVASVFSAIGALPVGMLMPAMLIDCMDLHEWKTGERVEAVFGSMNSLANKLGVGLSSALLGGVLSIAGFNADLEIQTASANTAIIFAYAAIPMILYAVMLLLLFLYKADRDLPQARAALAAEKTKNTNPREVK